MEHRGIEYQIQELATARRWKWTVFATQTKTTTGISKTRADAVLDAEQTIDRVVLKDPKIPPQKIHCLPWNVPTFKPGHRHSQSNEVVASTPIDGEAAS